MKNQLILQHNALIQATLSLFEIVLLGLWVNILSDALASSTILEAIRSLRYQNSYFIFGLIVFGGQIYLSGLPKRSIAARRRKIIDGILEAACKSLVHPELDRHIRAIITICDHQKNTRTTRYSYNIIANPERYATYPLEFGVTGEAINGRRVVVKPLSENHLQQYPDKVKKVVDEKLRFVLAAPIFNPAAPRGPLIGVLAFDSFESLEALGLESENSKILAQHWADLVADVLV